MTTIRTASRFDSICLPEEGESPARFLSWTVHPARQSPGLALFASGVTLGTAFAIAASTTNVAGLLALAVLVLSLRRFYFPTESVIDEMGIAVRCLGFETRFPWKRLRRFHHDERGAFLSTRSQPGMLDSLKGLQLTWAGNRDEAVAAIERYMAASRTP